MTEPAIWVDGLGKRYQIGARQRYRTLRDSLSNLAGAPARAVAGAFARRGHPNPLPEGEGVTGEAGNFNLSPSPLPEGEGARPGKGTMWALRDVSFEVKRGEVLGIIGRNGAGKSTLLKILSRITAPTRGRAEINGRVGSLLEVGTGFHPELTGRENIYLNGAILGMKRAEIDRGFDEIVEFAGIEEFLDTPVKRYSSGMHMRLAFSVAAHLQTEILLVDEVLAVGDAVFQLKCLNKMSEVSTEGRTILFVSHNMEAVTKLCGRGVLLDDGRVAMLGTPQECVDEYLSKATKNTGRTGGPISLRQHPGRTKQHDGPVRLSGLVVANGDGRPARSISCGAQLTVRIGYEVTADSKEYNALFSLAFSNHLNRRIGTCRSVDTYLEPMLLAEAGEVTCRIPRLPLAPGSYKVSVGVDVEAGCSDCVYDAAVIEVVGTDFYPSGQLPARSSGEVLFEHEWVPPKPRL